MRWKPFKTALVLGGGGARGLAHLGVLGALRETGFVPDMVVGTSFGAIVGATYALTPDALRLGARFRDLLAEESVARVERQFGDLIGDGEPEPGWRGRVADVTRSLRRLMLWNRHAMRQSLVDSVLISELIERVIGRSSFGDLRIPFYAIAFDLVVNNDVIIGGGDLALALRASSTVPGVFEPVAVGERLLVDGAVFQELPTIAARRLGADFVLAVDVGRGVEQTRPKSAAEVLERVLALRGHRIRAECRSLADVLVSPAVADMHWSEFSRAETCYKAGEDAMKACLSELPKAIARARRRTMLKRMLPAPLAAEVVTLDADGATRRRAVVANGFVPARR